MREKVERYKDMVYRLAFSCSRNQQDAEDISQDVFQRLFENGGSFTNDDHERNWLVRVTINRGRDLLRQKWLRNLFIDDFEIPAYDHYEEGSVLEAVLSLSEKYRTVIHLYYFEEYAVKEIAEILNEKETAVQTQLQRARAQLRKKLGEDFDHE